MTLLGRGNGRLPDIPAPNILVGLGERLQSCRVGLNPLPVSCVVRALIELIPVNCLAIVVVPVN